MRVYFVLITGLLFQYMLYELPIFIPWFELVVAYYLTRNVPRKFAGWIITIFALLVSSIVHIERMINDYGGWHLGVSTSMMLQCIHLSSFAWDYTDGAQDPAKLSTDQKKYAIKEYPGIIEFLAAAVSPGQSFSGPASNFNDFMDWIYLRGDFEKLPDSKNACFKRFMTGVCFIFVNLVLTMFFPSDLLTSENYPNESFINRHLFLIMNALRKKSTYYIGWSMAEAAIAASGQSYNGIDEKTKEPKFDRFYVIDILSVEFNVFSHSVTEAWNHSTHIWLKRYIYFRMNRVINRETAIYTTYIVSAFWHGFYPAYFHGFILYAITTENHKAIYQFFTQYDSLKYNKIAYVAE